jgi:hypothetical protein
LAQHDHAIGFAFVLLCACQFATPNRVYLLGLRNQLVLPERRDEFAHVVLDNFAAGAEFVTDHIHNLRLGSPTLHKFKNPRPDAIQVEHLALLDVQNDCAILSVRTANSSGNSVHGLAPLGHGGLFESRVAYTLPPRAVEALAILEFVRERIRLPTLGSPLQRDAEVASDFAKTECVRFSV